MHHGEYEWNHDFPRIAREAGFKFCEFQNENIDWKFIGELFLTFFALGGSQLGIGTKLSQI